MTNDPLARVTELLQGAVRDEGDVEALPPLRDEAIAKLEEALRARGRARRKRRVLGAFAAAAGFAALVTGGVLASTHGGETVASQLGRVREPRGIVTAVRDGHPTALSEGVRVAEGTELVAPAGAEAHLDFDTGTQVTLGNAARVRLVEQSKRKRFALEAGSFFAKVAKLAPDERFVVATSDSEIEVRGTAFRVSIAAPDPACSETTPTRLEVTEGVVVVRHGGKEIAVPAGAKWPSCPEKPTAATAVPTAVTASTVAVATAAPITTTIAPAPTTAAAPAIAAATPSSRLAEQNDLYEQAMRDKREGRTGSALATLDRLLATYPQGPLAESASAERMRILAATDRPRAAAAARDYLRRYPRGLARAEAEALSGGSAP